MSHLEIIASIDKQVVWIDAKLKTARLTELQKTQAKTTRKGLIEAKTIVKRVNHYGGIDNLLKLAEMAQSKDLFSTENKAK